LKNTRSFRIQIKTILTMPFNELFSFEILVGGQPLPEYAPDDQDNAYPAGNLAESNLDRISYVEASPGSEFTIKITYLGEQTLTDDLAFSVNLYIDSLWMRGKRFHKPEHRAEIIRTRLIADGMEQK
jgi:hypothetical protein